MFKIIVAKSRLLTDADIIILISLTIVKAEVIAASK